MSQQRIEQARAFVAGADLPATRGRRAGEADGSAVLQALDTTKQQAAIVASEVVAFASGVGGQFRQDLVNSTLLAQLVANQKVPDRSRVFDWYDAYFDVLANIGWAVQGRDFAIYNEQGQNFDAHKAILTVLGTVLAPAASALAIVTSTLEALQSMDQDQPWIRLFARESQDAKQAHFQVTAVSVGQDQQPFVTLAAFGLEAHAAMAQVLFFRWHSSQVTLRHCSGRVSIDEAVADAVRAPLRQKLSGHAVDYIRALPDVL